MNRINYLLLFILCLVGLKVSANPSDSAVWAEMREGYQYDPPESVIVEMDTTASREPIIRARRQSNPIFWQILMYAGIVLGVTLLIWWLTQQDFIRDRFKKSGALRNNVDEENPDELVLDELELELQQALANGNYNRCLRYLFLLTLERMESRKIIKWHKYTTNGEYLNAVVSRPWYAAFERITYTYEYYWYGEHTLSKQDFDWLHIRINDLMQEIGE